MKGDSIMNTQQYVWEDGYFRVRRKKGAHLSKSRTGSGLLSGNTLDDITHLSAGSCELRPVSEDEIRMMASRYRYNQNEPNQEFSPNQQFTLELTRSIMEPVSDAIYNVGVNTVNEHIIPGLKNVWNNKIVPGAKDGAKKIKEKLEKKEIVEGEIVDDNYNLRTSQAFQNGHSNRDKKSEISEKDAKCLALEILFLREAALKKYEELSNSTVKESNGLKHIDGDEYLNICAEYQEDLFKELPENTSTLLDRRLQAITRDFHRQKEPEKIKVKTRTIKGGTE